MIEESEAKMQLDRSVFQYCLTSMSDLLVIVVLVVSCDSDPFGRLTKSVGPFTVTSGFDWWMPVFLR
jgi:hypothetical protein